MAILANSPNSSGTIRKPEHISGGMYANPTQKWLFLGSSWQFRGFPWGWSLNVRILVIIMLASIHDKPYGYSNSWYNFAQSIYKRTLL